MKEKRFRVFDQVIALRKAYPDSKCDYKGNLLIWVGKLRPSPLSLEYNTILRYQLNNSPEVWIIGKELQKLDDPNFPHHYKIDVEKHSVKICLYRHAEFSDRKLLAKTIIPWSVEWLYYYELWLITGEWLGGGEHIE